MGAAVLAWALLLPPAAGCGTDYDRGRVLPAEDQLGDPEVYWRHQGERRGDEPTVPMEPSLAPKTSQE